MNLTEFYYYCSRHKDFFIQREFWACLCQKAGRIEGWFIELAAMLVLPDVELAHNTQRSKNENYMKICVRGRAAQEALD